MKKDSKKAVKKAPKKNVKVRHIDTADLERVYGGRFATVNGTKDEF